MSIADVEILTPGQAPVRGSIGWDESGRITEISREVAGSPLLDGAGELIAVPGFIDIHTHGANGADLSQATLE
ncbi:MAG: N-acetylglucosamine-6-phosphate deacetylase, partial [Verrucomicrobiota bacterium]